MKKKASDNPDLFKTLKKGFNKKFGKKHTLTYIPSSNSCIKEIQNKSKHQCLGKVHWPEIKEINAWMMSAETGTFMKWGGLGMVAAELPEAFNKTFGKENCRISVITPLYTGNTGKKKASFDGTTYTGAEHRSVQLNKIKTIDVSFAGDKNTLKKHKVTVYSAKWENTNYIFLENERFFTINPHKDNPSAQDGCYVLNENNINEVERFAFFSKAVYKLIENICLGKIKDMECPNVLLANDWHSGAISGLIKYLPPALLEAGRLKKSIEEKIKNIPVIHITHHLGYQGWDFENTAKILNSLYEDMSSFIFKNAKTVKNSNPRTANTLIVYDCYNQAACNFFLADRIVAVSRNYMEEVSKELSLGLDFRDVLKIRKDHRNFFGIVNGYDKKLIAPTKDKISAINEYFQTDYKFYDENKLDAKRHNKSEFIKMISQIAEDKDYKERTIPLLDTYKFDSISNSVKDPEQTPIFCATSRLVEQKGYDIAAQAILKILGTCPGREAPIFVLGGAGDKANFEILTNLKDKATEINPDAARRIFVFRGYKDEFAYAVQLAADFYLMPSRFEPCGLTQMEAMAKGALPLATSTGGLVDTIEEGVDGFRTEVFFTGKHHIYGNNITAKRIKNNVNAYTATLCHALKTFYDKPEKIRQMQINAMRKDFGWDVPGGSVYKYRNLLCTGHI